MNVLRGGRQLFASLDSARQSHANLARIWGHGLPPHPTTAQAEPTTETRPAA